MTGGSENALELHGFISSDKITSGIESVLMDNIQKAIVKINAIIYDTFARSNVSQNEVKKMGKNNEILKIVNFCDVAIRPFFDFS